MASERDRLPIRIGDRRYEMEVEGFQRQFVQPTLQSVDQGVEADERSLVNQGIWKRTVIDSGWGRGQKIFDVVDASDRRRFADSKGVDIWERHRISLLPETTQIASTADYDISIMLEVEDVFYFYVTPNDVLEQGYVSWTTSPWQELLPTQGYPPTRPILAMAYDGLWVYEACGIHGLYRRPLQNTIPADPETITDGRYIAAATENIWFVNDRLFALEGDTLYEVSVTAATRTSVLVTQHQIVAVVGMAQGIFVITKGSLNSGGTIFLLPINPDDGTIDPARVVGETVAGERVTAAIGYGSVLAVASTMGVRFYEVSSNDQLRMGPVHEIPGVVDLARHGNFIYALSNDHVDIITWRFHLGRATGDMEFAFASDVRVEAGIGRGWKGHHLALAWDGETKDPLVFISGPSTGTDQMGVWRTSVMGHRVSDGWIDYGIITFGTPERVMTTTFEVTTEPLPEGASLSATIVHQDQTRDSAGITQTPGSTLSRANFQERQATTYRSLRLHLGRGNDSMEAPGVLRWTIRGMPVPERVEIFLMPMMLYPSVFDGRHGEVPLGDLFEEYSYLKNLARTHEPVELQLGDETTLVYIDDVAVGASQGGTHLLDWTEDRKWLYGVWTVSAVSIDNVTETIHAD